VSGQVLTPDAIAALVEAAKEGKLPEESHGSQRRRGRVRTVDFTRPSKFTSDQERRFGRSLETFCRTASTRLSAELRMPLELEVISTAQLTWANAHAQVPNESVAAIIDVQPLGTNLLLSAERILILDAIELLLGGSGNARGAVANRRLTDIDWALSRHFLDRMLAQLSVIWADLADIEIDVAGVDSHLETAQLAPVSEPTLAITIEARLAGGSSTLTLLVPYVAIAAVAHRFGSRDDTGADENDAEMHDQVQRAIGTVEVTVRAEVAAVELPIEQVLGLVPGDVLRLDAPASGGVTLFADEVPVQRARPGRSGGRRAVQIIEPARRTA
jgi:flagellar motor switch protein FliM